MALYGNMIGGAAPLRTLIIEDDSGNTITGVVTGSEVVFTATDNDVRKDLVYASDNGISVGTKVIPAYHTTEGYKFITSGSDFVIQIVQNDKYDFTKFQAIICPYTTSIAGSVAAEKVVINDGVYVVNSTELVATVTKNSETQSINLGIKNESPNIYLVRYFTYKEIV